MQDNVVIVGTGQAALSCAVKLRDSGYEGAVTMLGDEPWLPYQRPPLSKAYLKGETTADRLEFRPQEFFAKAGIGVERDSRVTSIDRSNRSVTTSDGRSYAYTKLVLTTGSRARTLPDVMTHGLDGILTLRSIADADRLRRALASAKRIVVVGGGYVGLEVASIAVRMGHAVTIVEMADRVLKRVAGAPTAEAIEELHARHGATILTNAQLTGFSDQSGKVAGVALESGTMLPADLVLVAIGGTANVELAAEAGLTVENGIVVDRLGQTSGTDIYAAGDCAAFPFGGRLNRLESVQNAIEQGGVVANAILGRPVEYEPVPWFWSDQYDTKLQTAGLAHDYDDILTVSVEPGCSAFWYFRDGLAVAVDTMNDAKTHMAARRLFGARVALRRELLLKPDFNLMQYVRTAAAPSG
ncbi:MULTISPECIES: NAD(P)/FAD-dependent oxidoreductase [unclassified Mesorhizobium]|uniref:NAD(P)/FAD-dependent oxidoreductase n=1 Tax=unclassified Mesorhizobium TaxID=325217 RepID=UPI000FD941CA|nr:MULTISPECIES: FAD-dependent oxidoreductase [unclassified Mesorhizobium]RWE25143.1 MAG: pyridine nucleotide-disulfide oxidoreductase [Mesorhizobium sp.]TGQ19015.1 pyridine nucleotide-disulfide oxidoreductase [Mesorhizobium sp. M00.F.Ca.ET.217.01.1.1]TGV89906.1 pyridine nucleotide-disulfide oxidoreductase [Mesorhizobium sp. M00.F.Ca.ET.158.01.1.1]